MSPCGLTLTFSAHLQPVEERAVDRETHTEAPPRQPHAAAEASREAQQHLGEERRCGDRAAVWWDTVAARTAWTSAGCVFRRQAMRFLCSTVSGN